MAYSITDKPNTEAPSADYPFGNIRDKTPSVNGTPVNKLVYADFHQFFAKLMDYAGVTPNGLPDNEYSGFQLMEALHKGARPYKSFVGYISQTGVANPVLITLENTIGTITPGRDSSGNYGVTSAALFTSNKTWVMIGQSDVGETIRAVPFSDSVIAIFASGGDGTMQASALEIRVYEDL